PVPGHGTGACHCEGLRADERRRHRHPRCRARQPLPRAAAPRGEGVRVSARLPGPRGLALLPAAALCAALGACSTRPVAVNPPPPAAVTASVQRPALEYYHWVRAAS